MDSKSKNNDPFGKAILAYANTKNKDLQIEVLQEDFEPDLIPIHYLFRTKKDMPKLELDALKLCKEKVLDVGAAAACHSKILKDNGLIFQSQVSYLIPIFGTILGYIFLKELITIKVLISLTAVCIGIYFVRRADRKKLS